MKRRAIAFMTAKFVTRMMGIHLDHDPVARHLRNDARGGDTETECVAADERGLCDRKRANWQPVDEHVFGGHREHGCRAAHRLVRCAQNVQSVDLLDIDYRDGPGDLISCRQFRVDLFALRRAQLF